MTVEYDFLNIEKRIADREADLLVQIQKAENQVTRLRDLLDRVYNLREKALNLEGDLIQWIDEVENL
jgi:hypothetical protein